jgi:hypothetical protein
VKKILILVLFAIFNLYAEQITPYRAKVQELYVSFLRNYNFSGLQEILKEPDWNKRVEMFQNAALRTNQCDFLFMDLGFDKSPRCLNWRKARNNLDNQVEQAKSLKNDVDIGMEENRLIYEMLEKTKRDFANWQAKGEFETTQEWKQRLSEKSVENFERICSENLEFFSRYINDFKISLGDYNADKTEYGVNYTVNRIWKWGNEYNVGFQKEKYNCYPHPCSISFSGKIRISRDEAKTLSENFQNYTLKVKNNDWKMLDYTPYPMKISLYKKGADIASYEIIFPQTAKVKEIVFKGSELAKDNIYLKNVNLKYSDLRIKAEKEREKADRKSVV